MSLSRTQSLTMALAISAALLPQSADAMPVISFDFMITDVDFTPGGMIDFSADSFFIDAQTGGIGSLIGLSGDIDGGFMFSTLGAVTSTLGTLEVDDGSGGLLTGDLNLETIDLFNAGGFQFVSLTGSLVFDSYLGGGMSNADLSTLAGSGHSYDLSIGFGYTGLSTLANLFTFGDGAMIAAPATGTVELPEPRSLALLGLGIFSIGLYDRRRRRHQADHQKSRPRRLSYQTAGTMTYGTELTH